MEERPVGIGALLMQNLSRVHAHSTEQLPLASAQASYPLLIIQAGLGLVLPDYTTLCEALASYGYISLWAVHQPFMFLWSEPPDPNDPAWLRAKRDTGYVFGTLFGVLVLAITQTLIQFIGSLSSWWTKIVIGLLTLAFIGVQSILASRKEGPKRAQDPQALAAARLRRRRRALATGGVVTLAALAIIFVPKAIGGNGTATAVAGACQVAPFREAEAERLIAEGAVIVYHRTAGTRCVDELYAVYPDGRVTGNGGESEIEGQVNPGEVQSILTTIREDYGWFTDNMYSTWHNPCGTCYAHYLTISYDGQEKTITGVDGGLDMQPEYGYTLSIIRPILPKFAEAP